MNEHAELNAAAPEPDPLEAALRAALQPSYLLVRRLGAGGMGAVFLARDPLLKRDVAVKVLLPELAKDATARARFHREAEAVAAIAHPNVVSIYAIGELPDGTPYFVMQYASGRSLEARLERDGPLPIRDARRVLGEVASALAAAHKRGIVHRDIKPANVLEDETTGRVIVTDFGIAAVRRPGEAPSVKLTQTGMSPGTPYYMSPEQLLNEEATGLTDVYSFGVLAYELVTGAGPFTATSPHQMAAAHLRDLPAPLAQRRPDIDPELEHLVSACLAKQPSERPNAEQIVQRLAPGEHVLLEWPPPGLEALAGRLPRINLRLTTGSGLLALALLILVLTNPDKGSGLPLWLPVLSALAGFIALAAAVEAAWRLLRAARRAVARGYPWLVVLEAIADRSGDAGALIAGMKEYGALPPTVRSNLRSWRLVAAACAFGASVSLLPMLLLVLRLGASSTVRPWPAAALLFAPMLLLGAAAWVLRRAEGRVAHRPRTRRRRETASLEAARKAAAAWAASYQAASAGQALSTRPGRPAFGRAIASLVLAVVLVSQIVVAPIALMTPVYNILGAMAQPSFAFMVRRVRRAEAGRQFGVTTDRNVTAPTAGRMIQALALVGESAWAKDLQPPQPAIREPVFRSEDTIFGKLVTAALQDSLLRRAARGTFMARERALLERLAAHPSFPLFGAVARAAATDIMGTRYQPGVLDSETYYELSLPRIVRLREEANARSLVAALRLSQGRREEAETLLREEVSFGLRLMDDAVFGIETAIGAAIATNGVERLQTFYEVTGRSEASQRLREARDSALARAERDAEREASRLQGALPGGIGSLEAAFRSDLKRALSDSSLPRSLRWTMVQAAAFEPCRNGRELIFGPSRELTQALMSFRRELVHSPSDSAYFRNLMQGPFRRTAAGGPGRRIYLLAIQTVGALLGNERFTDCARFAAPVN